jgi:hypothetical protein
LPSVLVLSPAQPEWLSSASNLDLSPWLAAGDTGPDRSVENDSHTVRLHLPDDSSTGEPWAVVLPLDDLIELRLAALEQFIAVVRGRIASPPTQVLSPQRRRRLWLALRALDGKLDKASYREIAEALFGLNAIPERGWKTHDLRDRNIRLVRYGVGLVSGGYKHLLRHPFRRRP